ncbi:MAG: hypothetical protein JSW46_04900 [Gemmatimonadota bacterium]|nr:MAG: hypothetical protein JSW46_04900 [Gemmatimonadota bacterium]
MRDLVGHHARLRGPIVFDEGRYTLVSSVLNPDRSVVASGRAPVLEGNQLAFSFYLDPVRASLLSGSLTTATPDVSVVFDMTFSGLRDAYDAELVIDWSEVHKTVQATAGGSVFFIGADVDVMVGELQRTSAILLRSAGEDATMERLVTSAYEKAVELLFRPIEIDDVPEAEQGNLLDALAALASPEGLSRAARAITGFGLYGGFRLRDIKTSGSSVLTFSHSAAVDRHATIVFNIGDLHRRWGGDPDLFRHLRDDPAFRRREITLTVDGALVPELESYINGVTVTMRKRHDSGRETVDEVFLSRARLASDTGEVRLSYGWDDTSWAGWSQYEYRLSWSFRDGGTHTTDWIRTDNPAINLYTPYERRSIELLGDLSTLTERGVQAVAVEIEYLFFGRPLRESVLLRPTEEADDARQIDITIPRGELVYDYKITWFLTGGRRAEATGRDSSGLILVNEMPGDRP